MTPWKIYLRLHAENLAFEVFPAAIDTIAQNVLVSSAGAGTLMLFQNPYLLCLVRSFDPLICVLPSVFAWIKLHDAVVGNHTLPPESTLCCSLQSDTKLSGASSRSCARKIMTRVESYLESKPVKSFLIGSMY